MWKGVYSFEDDFNIAELRCSMSANINMEFFCGLDKEGCCHFYVFEMKMFIHLLTSFHVPLLQVL